MRAGLPPFPTRSSRPSSATTHEAGRGRPIDPYVLLEVAPTASIEDVKAAFRKKALDHHPDRGGTADAFMAIKRAYDAIVKRRARKRAR